MKLDQQTRKSVTVIVIAILAMALMPMLVMVGCSMPMVGNLCEHGIPLGPIISSACGGIYQVLSTDLTSVAASGFTSLLIALFAAIAAVTLILAPASRERAVVPVRIEPPPEPDDPLGERLTL